MDDCAFCEIYASKNGVVFENEAFFSRFDKFPASPGHAEVVPKRHVVSLSDLTDPEWSRFKPAIDETVRLIGSADLKKIYGEFRINPLSERSKWFCGKMLSHPSIGSKPDGYNFGVNDGTAAGRTVHHLHMHIIPRYEGDVDNPTGGVRKVIPNMGDYT